MSENQNKKSNTTGIKELIRKKHPDAWLIESVSIESELKVDGYGAFTQDKLFIYKLSPEKKLILINTMDWPEGKNGRVDHFAIKSHFTIDGINLTIANHGKDFQLFLEEQKKDSFTKISRPFYRKILGFRSKKVWKMAVALFIYLLFIIPFVMGMVSGITDSTFISKEELQKKDQLLATTEQKVEKLKNQLADKDTELENLEKQLNEKETELQKQVELKKQEELKNQEELKRQEEESLKEQEARSQEEQKQYTVQSTTQKEYYKNCTELRKVYPSGVSADHPAYASKHDRDKDGWACER